MTRVRAHVYVTLDEDGEPAAAYPTMHQADDAVNSDDYRHEHEVDMVPDVPLMHWDPGEIEAEEIIRELEERDEEGSA